ncbi:MAG TPA: hypothetical protein PK402_00440, partial [Tepidisphaeraceae bacterium]|nr:hypothetical protein [Tepidisphaeraceae bacterium]
TPAQFDKFFWPTLKPVIESLTHVPGRVDSVVVELKTDARTLPDDTQRLKAWSEALAERNADIVRNNENMTNRLGSIDVKLARLVTEHDGLREEVNQLQGVVGERPGAIELRDFERARNEAQSKLSDTRAAVERQLAEIVKLEQTLKDAEAGSLTPTEQSAEPDSILTDLESQIARETESLNQLSGPANASDDARAKLEAALDAFATEVETARQSINDQPDVIAYVDSAQKLLANIRERIDAMSRRQETYLTRLADFRKQLSELIDDQRALRESGDKQLTDMRDQLAFQQRMLNVAQDQGATESIDEINARISLLEGGIAARLELLADPRETALKQQLEQMVQATEREMVADRTENEQFLSDMTSAFVARQPALEKLPDDQKKLAQNLADRLASITFARQTYSRTLDDSSTADQARRAAIKARIDQLKLAVTKRQNELASAQLSAEELAAKVESTRTALASAKNTLNELTEMNAKYENAFTLADNTLREAERKRDLADSAVPAFDTKRTRMLELNSQIENAERERKNLALTVSNGIQPMPIADDAITIEQGTDHRLLIAILSSILIAAFGAGYLFWIFGKSSRDEGEYTNQPSTQGMTALRA